MPRFTPEDLINSVIEADDIKRRAKGLFSTRAALALAEKRPAPGRRFIEPFFNVLGRLWAFVMCTMPSFVRRPYVQWVNTKMGGYSPIPTPGLPARIEETVRVAKELKQQTGQWPALLILTSHPDTEGPYQWIRFEVLRQGLQIADAVEEAHHPGAWYSPHPRCFLAIDPFALDTVSHPIAGFYAGWMHGFYIAWDRQPSTQSWIQKHFLLRHTGYRHIAWRLLDYLRNDTPVLMALGGGLPYNARMLYAVREFVQRLPLKRWKISKRAAQIELMKKVMQAPENTWPEEAVREIVKGWEVAPEQIEPLLKDLREEFRLVVPYRERLFRILSKRLVARGKPLILVAISHSDTPPHARISAPVALSRAPDDIAAFARRFVTSNF